LTSLIDQRDDPYQTIVYLSKVKLGAYVFHLQQSSRAFSSK